MLNWSNSRSDSELEVQRHGMKKNTLTVDSIMLQDELWMRQREKPSPNHRSRFFENWTAETEFSIFELQGRFGSVFRKPISEIFTGFCTSLSTMLSSQRGSAKIWHEKPAFNRRHNWEQRSNGVDSHQHEHDHYTDNIISDHHDLKMFTATTQEYWQTTIMTRKNNHKHNNSFVRPLLPVNKQRLSYDRRISALTHRFQMGCYNLATACYH